MTGWVTQLVDPRYPPVHFLPFLPLTGHLFCILLLCKPKGTKTFTLSLPPATEVSEGYVFTGVCLSTGRGFSVRGGVSVQGVFLSRAVSVQGGFCQGDPCTVMCGRYASYWKTFLFSIDLFSLPYSIIFKCD